MDIYVHSAPHIADICVGPSVKLAHRSVRACSNWTINIQGGQQNSTTLQEVNEHFKIKSDFVCLRIWTSSGVHSMEISCSYKVPKYRTSVFFFFLKNQISILLCFPRQEFVFMIWLVNLWQTTHIHIYFIKFPTHGDPKRLRRTL
jgi:hypothetical protein